MVKKIDFHIHTISSEKDYEFSYSSSWLQRYVQEAKLDAIAITNHDIFDLENFKKVKQDLPNTQVFPGMELSLEEGHVNIVFDESNILQLAQFSDWLENKKLGEKGKVTTEEFCEHMHNWSEGIFIFEMGKSNSLSVPEKLSKTTFVGGVANQLKFQAFYKNNSSITPVLFSDAHASEDDPEEKRRDINLLKKKNTFIQVDNCNFSEIRRCISDKSKIAINKENLNNIFDINGHRVSTGLNLIVGKRGTGKTEFLKTVKFQYDDEDIYDIPQFETSKSDRYIKEQRKEQGQLVFDQWKKTYSSELTAIQEYIVNSPENFDKEIDTFLSSVKKFAKDTTTSGSKEKYKLIQESNFESISTKNLELYLEALTTLIDSQEIWDIFTRSEQKKEIFLEAYNEIRIECLFKIKQNIIRKEVNNIQNAAKKIVEIKRGISPVSNCEFTKIIQKHQTEKAINNFMNTILVEKVLDQKNIYGYQIIVKLSPFENADQFRRDNSTNEAVYNDLMVPYYQKEYIKFLKNLKKKSFFKTANIADYLLHMDVKLLDSDGTPASGGQAVGFALMMRLEEAKNKPIILIDEPEASLDNAYIREELIKAIKNLTNYSTVFVVTHNSTLGALLEPDYLVVTTKRAQNDYRVLTGEFSSTVISEVSGYSENSYSKFVEAMESGIHAYNKKGEIYESLSN